MVTSWSICFAMALEVLTAACWYLQGCEQESRAGLSTKVQVGRRKELKTRLIDLQSQQPSHGGICCRPQAVLLYKIVSPFHFNEMTYQNLFLMSHCKSLRNANVKGLGANSLVISAQLQKSVSHQLK